MVGIFSEQEMIDLYGSNWQSKPRIYGSGGMDGGTIEEMIEKHKNISFLLAPEFIFLSPLRAKIAAGKLSVEQQRSNAGHISNDKWFCNEREFITRDLQDVRRSKAILVNLKPNYIDIQASKLITDNNAFVDDKILIKNGVIPDTEDWQHIKCLVENPLTGTTIECYEAWKNGIPVIGFNHSCRSAQMGNPWLSHWFTNSFDTIEEAINYLKAGWIL